MSDETKDTTVAVVLVQCSAHGTKGVLVGDTRITTSECCGTWDKVLHHWPRVPSDFIARALDQFAALRAPAPSEAVASSTWGDLAPVVAVVLSASGVQAHEWDNLRADEQRDTLARIIGTMHPAPARGVTVTEAMVDEMAKQAALGHTRFCVGVHENGEAEWIEWPEAFTRLLTPDAP